MQSRLQADPAAFFRAHYPGLYRFVLRETGGAHADVEDLVQETLVVAWRDRASFRGEADPFTWILGILKNRIRNWSRGRSRRENRDEKYRLLARIDSEDFPDEIVASSEFRVLVWHVLEEIGEEAAGLLRERHFEGRKVSEMARRRGETEKAIEHRLRSARDRFRKTFTRGAEDEF